MLKTVRYLWNNYTESVDYLCRRFNRNRFLTAIDMFFCAVFQQVLPSEYLAYGFDFVPRRTRRDYASQHKRLLIIRKLNAKASHNIMNNKYYFARIMEPYTGRKCLQTLDLSFEAFQNFIEGEEKFIYKPFDGYGGHGHVIYRLDSSRSPEDIYQELITLPRGVIEHWIVQHEALNRLYSGAVHTVRLHTIHNGDPENILFYGSNLSIAFKGELANTCLDTTLSAQVDDATGVITTDAYDADFNILKEIPGSGVPIRGFQLPDWDKALAVVKAAAATVPELGYIGWDVAFTPQGPVIVEGNIAPGTHGAQSRCWVSEGLSGGVWPLLRPYLK